MKGRSAIYILAIAPALLFGATAYCQSRVTLAIGAGVNCSDLPNQRNLPNGHEKTSPAIAPLLFASIIVRGQGRSSLSVAAAYTHVGQTYSIYRSGFDIINQQSYFITVDEVIRLNQISFPLSMEYAVGLKRANIGITLGITAVYFVSGDYSYNYALDNDVTNYYSIVKNYDPFNSTALTENASRYNSEVLFGIRYHLTTHWSFKLDYSLLLREVYFRETPPPGAIWDDPSYEHSYQRGNIQLAVQYALHK